MAKKSNEKKKIEIENLECENPKADYFELIQAALSMPPQGGFRDDEDMLRRIEIKKEFEDKKIGDKIEIRKSDLDLIKKSVANQPFTGLSEEVVDYKRYIKSLG